MAPSYKLLAFAALIAACGTPTLQPPTKEPTMGQSMGRVVVRLIGQSSSETSDVDAGMAAGRLFLVRKDGDKIAWVNCGNVIVPYGWRPSDKHLEHVQLVGQARGDREPRLVV